MRKSMLAKMLAAVLLFLPFGFVGCELECNRKESAFEDAGEEVDEAIEEAGDAVEEAGDKTDDATD